jgi:hypothetical protein
MTELPFPLKSMNQKQMKTNALFFFFEIGFTYVVQTGFELTCNPPTSAYLVLGFQMYTPTAGSVTLFIEDPNRYIEFIVRDIFASAYI